MGTAWLVNPVNGPPMVLAGLAALGMAVAGILLEAGQLNLQRAAVQSEPVDQETFWEGIPLYAGRDVRRDFAHGTHQFTCGRGADPAGTGGPV